jgi:RNA polymerase sigma-70 factor (ECF subfamily)
MEGRRYESEWLQKQEERHLFELAQRGHREPFDELMRRYYRPIYGFIYARTSDRDTAEDLTQETFLRAFRSIRKCKEREFFSRWLYTIAIHCHQELERKKRRFSRAIARHKDQIPDASYTHQSEDLATFLSMFLSLTDDERTVLSLKHQNGMSCQEIATLWGKPIGTVTSLLARAYERLREEIKRLKRENP